MYTQAVTAARSKMIYLCSDSTTSSSGDLKMINENLLTYVQIELVGWVHVCQ